MNENMMQLLSEFGFLAEEAHDVEQSVKDQITRAVGKDEVDTVAFGLETDDGQIVKVYVNAEHAEKFEQEMAEMLGEVDDIEEALNQISKDIEIVDVEWPEDNAEGGDAEDADPNATADGDDDDDDGSEVMNSKVYSKKNQEKEGVKEGLVMSEDDEGYYVVNQDMERIAGPFATRALAGSELAKRSGTALSIKYSKEAPKRVKKEELSYGDELTQAILETSGHSIANQLSTVNQHLIYQAIMHLGVPELALDRSPYRSAILRGIKDTALEMGHTPAMRNTLKLFIKHQAADERAEKHDKHVEPVKEPAKEPVKDEPKHVEKAQPKVKAKPQHDALKKHEPALPPADEPKLKEAVSAAIDNDTSAVGTFWAAIETVLNLLDPSADKELATRILESPAYKNLVSQAGTQVAGLLSTGVRAKLKNLQAVAAKVQGDAVTESIAIADIEGLLKALLKLADRKGNLASRVLEAQAFKRLLVAGKPILQGLNASVVRALNGLSAELGKLKLAEADMSFDDDDKTPEPKSSAATPADQASQKPDEPAAAPPKPPAAPSADASEEGVTFKAEGDSVTIAYPQGKLELAGENLERAMKALTNKQTLSIQLVGGKFAVFSPRGSSAVIKLMGTEVKINLAPPDISAFLDAAGQVAQGDEAAAKDDVKEAVDGHETVSKLQYEFKMLKSKVKDLPELVEPTDKSTAALIKALRLNIAALKKVMRANDTAEA